MSNYLCRPSNSIENLLETITTANPSDIFSGKTAYDNNGNLITGTYSLPSVNVTAGNMLSGTSAINSNGSVVYGSMVNRGSPAATLSVGGSKYYSAGYYSAGTVNVNSLPGTTASAKDIKAGKIALNSSGNQIIGTFAAQGKDILGYGYAHRIGNPGSYKNTQNSSLFDGRTFKASMTIGIFAFAIASNDHQTCEVICGGQSLVSAYTNIHPSPAETTISVYNGTTIYCNANLSSNYTIACGWCCWRIL